MSAKANPKPPMTDEEISDFFYEWNGYNADGRILYAMKAFWNKAVETANSENPIDKEKLSTIKFKDL